MSQTLHILRKDLRHLWPEIAASLTILVLFALFEARSWSEPPFNSIRPATTAASIFKFLLVVSWGIVILRAVHSERLSGANQFWTTRPYRWPALAASKLLLVLLVIYVPFALMQLLLLERSGLPVRPSLPGLLANLLYITIWIVLPAACVAVITRAFAQAVMVFLGLLVALTLFFLGLSVFVAHHLSNPAAPDFLAFLQISVDLLFLFAALTWQYRRRNTRQTIAAMVATIAILVALQVFLPGTQAVASAYPANPAAIKFAVDQSKPYKAGEDGDVPPRRMSVGLHIPFLLTGAAPGTNYQRNASRYTLTAADGFTWHSRWIDETGWVYPRHRGPALDGYAFVEIPRSVYQHLASSSTVAVHADFLWTELHDGGAVSGQVSASPALIPGLGVCATDRKGEILSCREPYSDIATHQVFADKFVGPCPGASTQSDSSEPQQPHSTERIAMSLLIGNRENAHLPSISPIESMNLYSEEPLDPQPAKSTADEHTGATYWNGDDQHRTHFCPGEPLTARAMLPAGRVRLALDAGITLKPLAH